MALAENDGKGPGPRSLQVAEDEETRKRKQLKPERRAAGGQTSVPEVVASGALKMEEELTEKKPRLEELVEMERHLTRQVSPNETAAIGIFMKKERVDLGASEEETEAVDESMDWDGKEERNFEQTVEMVTMASVEVPTRFVEQSHASTRDEHELCFSELGAGGVKLETEGEDVETATELENQGGPLVTQAGQQGDESSLDSSDEEAEQQASTVPQKSRGKEIFLSYGDYKTMKVSINKSFYEDNQAGPKVLRLLGSNSSPVEKERARCSKLIKKMLQSHGQKLTEFTSTLHVGPDAKDKCNFVDVRDWYATVVGWIALMPNLEKLVIQLVLYGVSSTHAAIGISSVIQQRPFPTLPKLETLGCNNWPNKVIRAALMANQNVQQLFVTCPRLKFVGLSLPHLKDLSLEKVGTNIETLSQLHAPALEILKINDHIPSVNYPHVIAALAKFRISLKDLNIRLPSQDNFGSFPEMLNVKTLRLVACGTRERNRWPARRIVELLGSFPGLRELNFSAVYGCNCNERECSYSNRTLGHRRKHLKKELVSKLWPALPKLKRVTTYSCSSGDIFWFRRHVICR